MRSVLTTEELDPARCVELARAAPSMEGADLVSVVAPRSASEWSSGLDRNFGGDTQRATSTKRVVAIDCGMKRNILRHLVERTGPVMVVPPTMSAAEILDHRPDGVLVSNGPGDPAAVPQLVETLRSLVGRVPIFGICLGHQVLALALNARSFKLKFGHRGGNQPVQNVATGRVEITAQNHGFAIHPESLRPSGAELTHINLNDRTLEGFAHPDKALFAVQYHPEASPGPHDATYLFDCFTAMMHSGKSPTADDMANAQRTLQQRRL
jgi:carbamoyl-phosphate synthase small subunit